MPLVISHQANCKYHIHDDETISILGHSDFEGEYWAIGDMIVFEDGTEAKIEQAKGELFDVWSEPPLQMSDFGSVGSARTAIQ